MAIQLLAITVKDAIQRQAQEQQFMHTDKKVLTHYSKGDKMTMQNIRFEDLMSILKNDDDDRARLVKYTVEDYDGNQINAEDLYVLDFHQMRDWLVNSVRIDNWGRATIVLNSGNFKDFRFRNVKEADLC